MSTDRVIRSLDDLRRLAPDAPLCPCPHCGAVVPFFHRVDESGAVIGCGRPKGEDDDA